MLAQDIHYGFCVDVQGMEGSFDMVVCMLGTLSHMLTNKQAAAAFGAAARHLRPGGLLLLELAHPGNSTTLNLQQMLSYSLQLHTAYGNFCCSYTV
jgi:SAM-dependent methyltransferase